ncbi:MAG: FHA domain-containing protein [Bdellovibrionales bacterium]|nr:FHA domain-containing protein [Bdellovibrionales bacterium]
MLLEVLIESEKPVIYVLNKPEIYIGSANTNDIVVQCSNISRKHIKLFITENGCQLTDMGSTNGTFMGSEQLVPGRRYEFKISESIRLGDRAFLTLLDKKQNKLSSKIADTTNLNAPQAAEPNPEHEKTRVVSLKDLQISKSVKVQKQREVLLKKKKKESQRLKTEKESLQRVSKIIAAWLILCLGIHFGWKHFSKKIDYSFAPVQKEGVDRVEEDLAKANVINQVDLLSREDLSVLAASEVCTTEEESLYCDKLPLLKESRNGLKISGESYVFFIDQSILAIEAGVFLKTTALKKNGSDSVSSILNIAFLNVLKDQLREVIGEELNEKNVFIAFYTRDGDDSLISTVYAFKGVATKSIYNQYYHRLKYSKKMNMQFEIPVSKLYLAY